MSNWFLDYRLDWIRESLIIYGFINREHIERKFKISTPQASKDLRAAMRKYPDLMSYNATTKRYELRAAVIL